MSRALVGLILLALAGVAHAERHDLLVRNARLVDGTGAPPRDGMSIRIEDGRIVAIGANLPADGTPELDARGATVLPGLIDAHVHASYVPGGDLRGDSPDRRRTLVAQQLRAYLACGVTTVLDAGIGTADALEIERWLAAGNPGPRVLTLGPGFFTPGGFMSPPIPGVATTPDVERLFGDVVAAHAVGVGVTLEHGWSGVPRLPIHSPEIRAAIMRGAAARGLPLYVHATSEDDQAIGLDMGAHALLQSPLYRRQELSRGFVDRMARGGTYQMTAFASADAAIAARHPARFDDPLVRLVVPDVERATAQDPAVLEALTLDMATHAMPWLPGFLRSSVARTVMSETSARFALAASQRAVRRLHEAGVPIVVGTETAGGPYDVHGPATVREIELLGGAGLSPAEAIAAATRVPARMLGLDGEIGTIAVGRRADLVLVRDDPLGDLRALRTVRITIKDGVAHTPGEWMGVDTVYDPPPPAAVAEPTASATVLGVNSTAVAGAFAFTTLLWGLLTVQCWRMFRRGSRTGSVPLMMFVFCALATVHYLMPALIALTADALIVRAPQWLIRASKVEAMTFLAAMPLFRHLMHLFIVRAPAPGRAWLVANYGTAALISVFVTVPQLVPAPTAEMRDLVAGVLQSIFLLTMGVLVLRELRAVARRGSWRPGGLGEAHSADLALLIVGLAAGIATLFLIVTGAVMSVWGVVLNLTVGLVLVAPFAVRVLGEMVRGVLLVVAAVTVTATVYFGVPMATAGLDPALRRVADFAAVIALALVLLGGQPILRRAIDRLVFRRSRRRQAELQEFLHGLAAELGTADCCRRAVVEIVRVMGLRGAAIVLRNGESFAAGDVALDGVAQAWPIGDAADGLPWLPLIGGYELRALSTPLRDALAQANVVGIVPIATPRRRWGHLLVATGFLAADFSEEDVQATCAFADQLALVIAGAELLARSIAVERMLAHREKLAAIGELAARIAHEIRNPVTAARSLAQQLAREASALDGEPARLILAELERVERQVAALLRFARREDFRFEPVELRELIRSTVDGFRGRLDAAGVAVALDEGAAVVARADREKLRQVLINLIENAIDALGAAPDRRLAVSIATQNGSATMRVADSGPGVDAEALPRLFEPFFSQKEQGTGLGLAIVRRTVEAHGGRVTAVPAVEGGLAFDITLPLARAGA